MQKDKTLAIHQVKENLAIAKHNIEAIEIYIKAKKLRETLYHLSLELNSFDIDWTNKNIIDKQKQSSQIDHFLHKFDNLKNDIDLYHMMDEDLSIYEEARVVAKQSADLYTITMLSGEYDSFDCFINIIAGSGGTEAQDWANILFNMYMHFGKNDDAYNITIIEYSAAEDAGIKSAVLKFESNMQHFPYGILKGETGTHRLIRQSPFNANGNRHTSFAGVHVIPVIKEEIPTVKIASSDIRIDTYRASGAGGQHVNTTDSAVRITHLSTGTVVQSQNERSQHRNKDTAMTMLRSKLFALYEDQKRQNAKSIAGEQISASWGSQIRSYVLDSARIKDLRTGLESTRVSDVLAGKIKPFLDAYIKWHAQQSK